MGHGSGESPNRTAQYALSSNPKTSIIGGAMPEDDTKPPVPATVNQPVPTDRPIAIGDSVELSESIGVNARPTDTPPIRVAPMTPAVPVNSASTPASPVPDAQAPSSGSTSDDGS